MRRTWTYAWICGALLLGGCAAGRGKLPTYPWTDADTAIAQMAKQDEKLKTLLASGSAMLTDGEGKTVRLDTAMVCQFPDYVRLRSWKMGQAVFDLTLKPEGVWLMAGEEMKKRSKGMPAGLGAADFAKGWSMLHGEFFRALNLEIDNRPGKTFWLQRRLESGMVVRCEVDRDTLTVSRNEIVDKTGKQRFSLQYTGYKVVNGVAVPARIIAKSEQGTIQVDVDDLQVNVPTPAGAFVPPRRAERLP
jgi:hypothetical protein